jgi:hypothetical protein
MDMNDYLLELLVRERLADMRERGERAHRILAARPESRSLFFALGHVFIQVGHRLRGVAWPSRTTTEAGGGGESRRTPGAVRG